MSAHRRPIWFNHAAQSWHSTGTLSDQAYRFHKSLPGYEPTPLISLDDLAKELGVGAVYLKHEGSRFGLPSFKILGASYGTYRGLIQRLGLSANDDLKTVKNAAAAANITLHAATDGNHGRAVAWMGRLLGIPVQIRVPKDMHPTTIALIESEGAQVTVSVGDYDEAVIEAYTASQLGNGILVQDFAFADYEEIPQWIVEGYQSMMLEVDAQLSGLPVDLVIAPVGVGSFAQAVTNHYRRLGSGTSVLTVEPDTAACLRKSLERGALTPICTTPTILAGLDCGTPSTTAWPVLQSGVRGSVTISDYESHMACTYLEDLGIDAGPCGASPVAALRRLTSADKTALGLNAKSVIVLPCTEGSREYQTPMDVSIDDPVLLTQQLVRINSASPTMGSKPGPGETAIARYITAWLEHRELEAHWIERTPGRPSVVGVARGAGGGKNLMFNGHIDTVTLMGYAEDPFSGTMENGKLYGRGAADMKCGVAAALVALANAKKLALAGDVIVAAVADEEDASIGTEDVLAAGWTADAALVNEPTDFAILNGHKGFVWLQVDIHGVASHGSRADLGVDAICKAGHFLSALDRHAQRLQHSRPDSTMGPPTIHASLIKGGEEASSYPANCIITIERRTLPGETPDLVLDEINAILNDVQLKDEDFKYDSKVTFSRPPCQVPQDSPLCELVAGVVGEVTRAEPRFDQWAAWTDCALLTDAGIPAVLWGPVGEGLHAKEEWVDVESIRTVTDGLTKIAEKFCKQLSRPCEYQKLDGPAVML